jgi:hypothetical protein
MNRSLVCHWTCITRVRCGTRTETVTSFFHRECSTSPLSPLLGSTSAAIERYGVQRRRHRGRVDLPPSAVGLCFPDSLSALRPCAPDEWICLATAARFTSGGGVCLPKERWGRYRKPRMAGPIRCFFLTPVLSLPPPPRRMDSMGRLTLRERLRNPPLVRENQGSWTLRELVGPPTTSVSFYKS